MATRRSSSRAARATCDIDLLSAGSSLGDALSELRGLAEVDLGDFVTFEFAGASPIKAEDEYRSGLSVRFIPMVGAKRMSPVSIDLVIDEVPNEDAEHVTPADRIDVRGIETCDYLVYPVESALADKLCAIIERHGGRPSSRVKDLVDIVVYATSCDVDGARLQRRIRREVAVRGIDLPRAFAIPDEWTVSYGRVFGRLCSQTGLSQSLRSLAAATTLAQDMLGPALDGAVGDCVWDHAKLDWTSK